MKSILIGLCLASPFLASVCSGAVVVVPACPGPSVPITIIASQNPVPPTFLPADALVSRDGGAIRLTLEATQVAVPGQSGNSKRVALGQLPLGNYKADVYYRYKLGPGNYSPEQFFGTVSFQVQASSDTTPCAAGVITVLSGGFQRANVGAVFVDPIVVEARDGQLRPVPNVQVQLERVTRPEDAALTPAQQPSATQTVVTASTDVQGLARFNLTANMASGTYQYKASFAGAMYSPVAFAVLHNRSQASLSGINVLPVVEYYNAARDHYFITQSSAEQHTLDIGLSQGWERTGAAFLSLPTGSSVPSAQPVCRFYGLPQAGLDSHFFSASAVECSEVLAKFSSSWALETSDAFREFLPNSANGDCAAGTASLYRTYNNRADANHRYTLSTWVIAGMISRGWIPEGYGPTAVAMCVPI